MARMARGLVGDDVSGADDLVRRLILRRFREEFPDSHLATCPDVGLADVGARDGKYGCDTGCEFARFEATVSCPHSESAEFEWGDFGEISYMIEDMEAEDEPAPTRPVPICPTVTLTTGDTITWTTELRIE